MNPSREIMRGLAVTTALIVAVGLVVLSLPDGAQIRVWGAVWVASAVPLIARARNRDQEQPAGWYWVGSGNLLVGAAWLLAPSGLVPELTGAWAIPLILGLSCVGVGSILMGPGRDQRTVVLDALLVALSLSMAIAVAVLVPLGSGADSAELATATTLTMISLVPPAVLVVSLISGYVRPTPRSVDIAVSILLLVVAGIGTAVSAVSGRAVAPWLGVAWIVSPIVSTGVVLGSRPMFRVADRPLRDALGPVRLTTMMLLTVSPAVASYLVDDALLAEVGLAAALVGALVLSTRVVATVRFELEHERDRAELRLEALIEHGGNVVALVDDEDVVVHVTGPVPATLRRAPRQVLGASLLALAEDDDRELLADRVGRARARPGVPVEVRVRADRTEDGPERHIECVLVDLRHVDGVGALSVTIRDVTQHAVLERELVRQARIDELTGLVNRQVLTDRVAHVMSGRDRQCGLLYLDVNDFKLINDGYGHAAGDRVLEVVGARIRGALRGGDTAGRLGGDEFAVLVEELSDHPLVDVLGVADRIHEACREPIVLAGGDRVTVRIAAGVATPEHGGTAARLFEAADTAMYVAKREGRDTVVFEEHMRPGTRTRVLLMRDLEEAIEQRDVLLHYQPIHEVATGRMHGVEALLRWDHPRYGWMSPPAVLDHAETASLTKELTNALLEVISRDLQRWRDEVGTELALSLNLSAEQLVHVDPDEVLVRTVGGRARGRALTIEVTETSMLGDVGAAARVLAGFRAAGCHVAVDDFGTGYASLGYLRRLPVDRLKIDREFIDGLEPANAPGSFAAVINELAHQLGLETVAEGVETPAHFEAVRAIGCEYAQGWLFGRAVPMGELIAAVHAGELEQIPVPVEPAGGAATVEVAPGWSP